MGDQLSTNARMFYDAMVQMYTDGIFDISTGSLDLTQTGFLSQDIVAAYMDEQNLSASGILADFGAARDAFWADYPSVFYVDFSNLSIRVTSDTSGTYHVYIGTGRTDTYFTQGFENHSDITPARIIEPAPIHTLLPMEIGFAISAPAFRISGSMACSAVVKQQFGAINTWSPKVT